MATTGGAGPGVRGRRGPIQTADSTRASTSLGTAWSGNPRTAALGAILLTGYLGGAIAAHVRHEDGWFPIVFCVVFGTLLWSGLLLRDARLRAVLPWNR